MNFKMVVLVIMIMVICSGVFSKEQGFLIEIAPTVFKTNDTMYVLIYKKSNIGKNSAFILMNNEMRPVNNMSILADLLVDGKDIYIVGESRDSTNHGAAYWKNGEVYPLGKEGRMATSICKYQNNIYISGITKSYNYKPCYWKNGKEILLEKGMREKDSAQAQAIFVDRHGVLVCGYVYDDVTGKYTACYWENGKRVDVDGIFANSILRHNGKIYMAGVYSKNAGGLSACYWINGRRYNIDGATANAIYVYREHLFIAGSYADEKTEGRACCWIDGIRHDLPVEGSSLGSAEAADIFVDQDGVYVSGYCHEGTKSVYWINGESKKIAMPL